MKIDIYPEKAQYITGEPVKLIVECDKPIVPGHHAVLYVTRLQQLVYENNFELTGLINEIKLKAIDTEFGGFGVSLTVYLEDERLYQCQTAFDVVADCSKAIRYGFLSDFKTEDGKECRDISTLRKFHINMVQYYDWSYRHDNLVSGEKVYKDMMGREVNLETVKTKIHTCRQYGMKSLGYGAVYAASKNYYNENKECALYTSVGEPLVFIDTFYIMNVAKECAWRKHIINEYAKAVLEVGFDGIHMDTYGFPKTAYSFKNQRLIRLEEEYPSLIEDTKARLNEITSDNHLIFNNVGNWPVGTVAKTPQDAVYIEVWDPYVTYSHIKQIIRDARREGEDKKPVILAAYLAPFRTDTVEQAGFAAYLLTAAITVNGAYHLLLGEENAVLTQGYYVDHSFMEVSTSYKMRSYYDFVIQYMELFYDSELIDVSMTHIGWDNTEYRCFHEQWSVDAQPGKIWITVREKEKRKLISLINLCGNDSNEWNRGKAEPTLQKNIKLQVQIDLPVKGIYFASPDNNYGQAKTIDYAKIPTERGCAIQFEVPYLELWSNIWIDF